MQADFDLSLHSANVIDLVTVINQYLDVVADFDQSGDLFDENPTYTKYTELVDPIMFGSNEDKTKIINFITDNYPTYADFFEEFSSLIYH